MTPTSHDLPAHHERFAAAASERLQFIEDTAAHVLDDLLTLLDDQALAEMRAWNTKNVHAYRFAAAGVRAGPVASRQYQSCVAKTSESFVGLGLITSAQKNAIVSAAAQSSCGRR